MLSTTSSRSKRTAPRKPDWLNTLQDSPRMREVSRRKEVLTPEQLLMTPRSNNNTTSNRRAPRSFSSYKSSSPETSAYKRRQHGAANDEFNDSSSITTSSHRMTLGELSSRQEATSKLHSTSVLLENFNSKLQDISKYTEKSAVPTVSSLKNDNDSVLIIEEDLQVQPPTSPILRTSKPFTTFENTQEDDAALATLKNTVRSAFESMRDVEQVHKILFDFDNLKYDKEVARRAIEATDTAVRVLTSARAQYKERCLGPQGADYIIEREEDDLYDQLIKSTSTSDVIKPTCDTSIRESVKAGKMFESPPKVKTFTTAMVSNTATSSSNSTEKEPAVKKDPETEHKSFMEIRKNLANEWSVDDEEPVVESNTTASLDLFSDFDAKMNKIRQSLRTLAQDEMNLYSDISVSSIPPPSVAAAAEAAVPDLPDLMPFMNELSERIADHETDVKLSSFGGNHSIKESAAIDKETQEIVDKAVNSATLDFSIENPSTPAHQELFSNTLSKSELGEMQRRSEARGVQLQNLKALLGSSSSDSIDKNDDTSSPS